MNMVGQSAMYALDVNPSEFINAQQSQHIYTHDFVWSPSDPKTKSNIIYPCKNIEIL